MNDNTPVVVANLKANKTWDKIAIWLDTVANKAENFQGTIIFCPSFPFLSSAFHKINANDYKIKLGAQDVSRFQEGQYTGEVAATQVADFCKYTIVGHSERRQNFGETEEILTLKVQNAAKAGITPIYCVQNENTPIPFGVEIVAFEPPFAIGSGNPDNPQDVISVVEKLKAKGDYTIIYGGSVTSNNVKSFISKGQVDGVLVGQQSLDPQNFIKILELIHT